MEIIQWRKEQLSALRMECRLSGRVRRSLYPLSAEINSAGKKPAAIELASRCKLELVLGLHLFYSIIGFWFYHYTESRRPHVTS